MSKSEPTAAPIDSPLAELGLLIESTGEKLHGRALVLPTMCAPGTDSLRVSILAAWADTILGLLGVRAIAPRVPVTLELDVQLFADLSAVAEIHMIARVTKAGRAVQVYSLDILNGDGQRLGFAHSVFMAAPDSSLSMPTGDWALGRFASRRSVLTEPFADRVGCRRVAPGVAELPLAPSLMNSSKTLNGGLLAVAVEEAVLSTYPTPTTLSSLHLHYLRPVRTGPAVARAEMHGALGEIEVRDAATDALAVVATARVAQR